MTETCGATAVSATEITKVVIAVDRETVTEAEVAPLVQRVRQALLLDGTADVVVVVSGETILTVRPIDPSRNRKVTATG